MKSIVLVLAMAVVCTVAVRGPHHPRGEKIVEHHVHYRPTRDVDEKLTQNDELLHDKAHMEVRVSFNGY